MKNKWVRFYTGIAAGTVFTGSLVAAKKMAKKYGRKPNEDKLIDINAATVIDYSLNKFLEADDKKLSQLFSLIGSNKNSDSSK